MAAGGSARTLASPLVCSASRIPRARAKYQVTPLALAQYSPHGSPICARGEGAVRVALLSRCAGGARGPMMNDEFISVNAKSPGHPHWVTTSLARFARWLLHTSYRDPRVCRFWRGLGLPPQPAPRRGFALRTFRAMITHHHKAIPKIP